MALMKGRAKVRSATQTLAWLRELVKSRSTEYDQNCGVLARTASGIETSGAPTAKAKWANTKHRGTGPASKAPAGAKIYWTRGSSGHVITSNGKGGGIANYWKDGGRVRELTMATWNASMGGPPAGWSYDIDGELAIPLPLKLAPKPSAKAPAKRVAAAKAVARPLAVPAPPPSRPDPALIGDMEKVPAEAAQFSTAIEAPLTGILGNVKALLSAPREPLGNRASVTAAVGLVVALLALVGVRVSPLLSDQLVDVLFVVIPVFSPLALAWWARRHVTPVDDPHTVGGMPLLPIAGGLVDDVTGVVDAVTRRGRITRRLHAHREKRRPPHHPKGKPTGMQKSFLDLHNAERRRHGVRPLRWNAQLAAAAQVKAEDMNRHGYFSHNDLAGRGWWVPIVARYGKAYRHLAQNIAKGFSNVVAVMDAWMNSTPHRRDVLDPASDEVGFGESGGYWCADFGAK